MDKLGRTTDEATHIGLWKHIRAIIRSLAKREAYLSHMRDLGYQPAVADAVPWLPKL